VFPGPDQARVDEARSANQRGHASAVLCQAISAAVPSVFTSRLPAADVTEPGSVPHASHVAVTAAERRSLPSTAVFGWGSALDGCQPRAWLR
jgi:hypothetical protein